MTQITPPPRRQRAQADFWNLSGRHEVDFVLEQGRRTLALEVKEASRWSERDLAGLRAWQAESGGSLALLACRTEAAVPLGDNLWVVPLGDLLR
ncbi:MAG: hypothetical protein HY814_08430 [Candidatus Riflebacteria bacterium]|nr:hypothetical protein [Candidatus Riflebacteria bacterium]